MQLTVGGFNLFPFQNKNISLPKTKNNKLWATLITSFIELDRFGRVSQVWRSRAVCDSSLSWPPPPPLLPPGPGPGVLHCAALRSVGVRLLRRAGAGCPDTCCARPDDQEGPWRAHGELVYSAFKKVSSSLEVARKESAQTHFLSPAKR